MFKRRRPTDSTVDSNDPIWLSDDDQPFNRWVYGELDLPSLRTIVVPPVHLMDDPAHRVVILSLMEQIGEMLPNLMKGFSHVSQPLAQLIECFAELVGPNHSRAVLAGPCLGYNVGYVENSHGNALAGKANLDFVMAMYALQSQMDDENTKSVYFDFFRDCGYYLARTEERSLTELCETARRDVRWLETSRKDEAQQ